MVNQRKLVCLECKKFGMHDAQCELKDHFPISVFVDEDNVITAAKYTNGKEVENKSDTPMWFRTRNEPLFSLGRIIEEVEGRWTWVRQDNEKGCSVLHTAEANTLYRYAVINGWDDKQREERAERDERRHRRRHRSRRRRSASRRRRRSDSRTSRSPQRPTNAAPRRLNMDPAPGAGEGGAPPAHGSGGANVVAGTGTGAATKTGPAGATAAALPATATPAGPKVTPAATATPAGPKVTPAATLPPAANTTAGPKPPPPAPVNRPVPTFVQPTPGPANQYEPDRVPVEPTVPTVDPNQTGTVTIQDLIDLRDSITQELTHGIANTISTTVRESLAAIRLDQSTQVPNAWVPAANSTPTNPAANTGAPAQNIAQPPAPPPGFPAFPQFPPPRYAYPFAPPTPAAMFTVPPPPGYPGFPPLFPHNNTMTLGGHVAEESMMKNLIEKTTVFMGSTEKDKFPAWLNKVDTYFTNAVDEEQGKKFLLSVVGGDVFEYVKSWNNMYSWPEMKELLTSLYDPLGGETGSYSAWQTLNQGTTSSVEHNALVLRIFRETNRNIHSINKEWNMHYIHSLSNIHYRRRLLKEVSRKSLHDIMLQMREMDEIDQAASRSEVAEAAPVRGVSLQQQVAALYEAHTTAVAQQQDAEVEEQENFMAAYRQHQQERGPRRFPPAAAAGAAGPQPSRATMPPPITKIPGQPFCPIHESRMHDIKDCNRRLSTECPYCHSVVKSGELAQHMPACPAGRCYRCGRRGHPARLCQTSTHPGSQLVGAPAPRREFGQRRPQAANTNQDGGAPRRQRVNAATAAGLEDDAPMEEEPCTANTNADAVPMEEE